MKNVLKILLLLPILIIALATVALVQNDVPWDKPPGFIKRLGIYLTENVTKTSDNALFPELRTRTYERTATIFFDELIPHLIHMGWDVQGVDKDNMTIHAVVSTPLLGFKDDVTIRIEAVGKKQARLHIRSASRMGRGDLAANLGHILRLYEEIELADMK